MTVEEVELLSGGLSLSVRVTDGPLRPFLLVHDAGADSHSWAEVADRLSRAGHQVAAVDLRGHGRSSGSGPSINTDAGIDTDTCADDLATLLDRLGFTGGRSAVVAGFGWGANVALSLAARRDGVAGVGCIAGGWLRPSWRYASVDAYRAAPGAPADASIAQSLYDGEPRAWYPLVAVPVALCPVVPPDGETDASGDGAATRTGIAEATARLPRATVSWYYAGSDVLRSEAGRLTDDLLALAAEVEPTIA